MLGGILPMKAVFKALPSATRRHAGVKLAKMQRAFHSVCV